MENINCYLSIGLWSIVEAILDAPEKNNKENQKNAIEMLLLDVATHPNNSRIASPTLRYPWQVSWLSSALIYKKVTSSSNEIRSSKWFSDGKLSYADADKLMKVSEMHGLLCRLPEPVSIELKNELVQLYIHIISVDHVNRPSFQPTSNPRRISTNASVYLKQCLFENPKPANAVMQRLLCVRNSNFVLSDGMLQDIYDEVFSEMLQSFHIANKVNIPRLLCILTIFEVSEEKEMKVIEKIFQQLINLCYSGVLSLILLYLSLIGRGKFGLLRVLISMEAKRQLWTSTLFENNSFYKTALPQLVVNDHINLREVFLRSYKKNIPWIEDVVEMCANCVIQKNLDDVRKCISNSGLNKLWPLIYFEVWEQFLKYGKHDIDISSITKECKHAMEDQKFLMQISEMELCLKFSEWILSSGSAKTDRLISVLEQVMNSCCAMHALKKLAKLKDLQENAVMTALLMLRGDPVHDSCKSMLEKELCACRGFYMVMTAYKAILLSIEADCEIGTNVAVDQNVLQVHFEESIRDLLKSVKASVDQIHPLTFRVEMLEYIFSLLFLQHGNLHDENSSDSGGEESDNEAAAAAPMEKSEELDSEVPVLQSTRAVPIKRKSSPARAVKLSEGNCSEASGFTQATSHGTSSLFVCGPIIIKELLRCLKDCLMDASVLLFSSLTKVESSDGDVRGNDSAVPLETLQKRMARLSHYVGEAACRLEIVSHEGLSSRKISHPFWHNLPGTADKPVLAFAQRQHSDESEDDRKDDSVGKHMATGGQTVRSHPRLKSFSENEMLSESGSQSCMTEISSDGGKRRGKRVRTRKESPRIPERIYCGFCQPTKDPLLSSPFGTIDHMLASPQSLVIQCLSQGEIFKAKKVIEIFKLEETPLSLEAKFVGEYVSLLHKLDKKTKEHQLNIETSTLWCSPLQSVKRAAKAGMHSTSFSSVIDGFQMSATPPTVDGLEALTNDNPHVASYFLEIIPEGSPPLHDSMGYKAVVLSDLAFTYSGSAELSSILLDSAMKNYVKKNRCSGSSRSRASPYSAKFPSYASTSLSSQPSGPMGFATLLQKCSAALKVVNDRCSGEDGIWSFIEAPLPLLEKKFSMPDLIASALPLCPDATAACLSFWEEVYRTVKEFWEVLSNDIGSGRDSVDALKTDSEMLTRKEVHSSMVNSAFNRIMGSCCIDPWHSEGISRPERGKKLSDSNETQYLQMLFTYLKIVSSAVIQTNPLSKGSLPCNFDVLNEDIGGIIGRLVFECDVHPSQLESMASKMNLDIVSCIMGNCCPPIGSVMPELECMELYTTGKAAISHTKVILNNIPKNWQGPCRPPPMLVEGLLSDILNELRTTFPHCPGYLNRDEIAAMMKRQSVLDLLTEGTYELANINIDLLGHSDEYLIFLTNLANLLTLHAILVLERTCAEEGGSGNETECKPFGLLSSHHSERLLAQMSVCYKVSSWGLVSIHNLYQAILGEDLALAIAGASSWRQFSWDNSKGAPFLSLPPHPSLITKQNFSPEPSLLFVLFTGHAWNAKMTVLSASNALETQLHSIISEYLSSHISPYLESPLSNPCLCISFLLWLHLKFLTPSSCDLEAQKSSSGDTASMTSTAASSSVEEQSVECKTSSVCGEWSFEQYIPGLPHFMNKYGQLQDINELISRPSSGSFQETAVKVMIPDCSLRLTLDYSKLSVDLPSVACLKQNGECPETELKLGSWPWRRNSFPTSVLEYLELRCWPLAAIAAIANMSGSSVFLPPLMPHATSLKHLLQEILNHPEMADEAVGIMAILSPEGLPSQRLWAYLDSILLHMGSIETLRLLGILNMIPQPRLMEEPKLMIFHDLVMWEIAARQPDQDIEEPWRYGIKIQDSVVRVACVLSNISAWAPSKEGICREALLSLCGNKDISIPARTQAVVLETLRKVELYEKVFNSTKCANLKSWLDVSQLFENDAGLILETLILSNQVTLFLKWMELHAVSQDVQNLIVPNALVLLLDAEAPEFKSARKLLDLLPLEHASKVCQGSLPYLNCPSALRFIISFLIESCHGILSDEELSDYKQWAIGLIMISHRQLLGNTKYKRPNHSHRMWSWLDLAHNPLLILEQLLMNVQLETLEGVLALMKPHICLGREGQRGKITIGDVDALLRQYAAKALDFRVCTNQVERKDALPQQTSVPPPSFKLSTSMSSLSTAANSPEEQQSRVPLSHSSGSVESLDLVFKMPTKVPSKDEWVPNDEVTVCMCCKLVSFSMFNRRHHCRRCGRVICGSCSTRRLKVAGYKDVSVRVCSNCHSQSTCGSVHNGENLDHDEAEEVDEDEEEREEGMRWWWRLTGDEAQDFTLREEFSYEQAPSASLCLAILRHHTSGDPAHPRLLLDSAEELLTYLRPPQNAQNSLNPEVDHALIIQMVRSLAVASKVLYSRIGVSAGIERCDRVIGRAGLLNLLVRSGWAGAGEWAGTLLDPQGCHEDSSAGVAQSSSVSGRPSRGLPSLRDCLVKEEQWELALEVATKGGVGRAGIWAAWGKACLRAGDWSRARSLFARCLQKGGAGGNAGGPSSTSPASHLMEIIKILEESSVALPVVMEDVPSYRTHPYPLVHHSLASLDAISRGIILLPPAPARERPVGSGPSLQDDIREECLFYLTRYGSEQFVVDFHLRHGEIHEALIHFLTSCMNPEIFLDEVYLRCLRMGWISELEMEMKAIDQSLDCWKSHLFCMCRLLEHRSMLQILYRVQVFIEDNVRASMTCIRFYCKDVVTYSQMRQNCVHLRNAQKHLEDEMAKTGWTEDAASSLLSSASKKISPRRKSSEGSLRKKASESPMLPLKMEARDLDRHINTIQRQDEVTKFLATCEASDKAVVQMAAKIADQSTLTVLPTLFGGTKEKVHLAVLTIICGKDVEEGFGLAFRIIQDYHLKAEGVFELAGKALVAEGRPKELVHLISCIQSSGIPECGSTCDQVAKACIHALVKSWEKGWDMAEYADEEDNMQLDHQTSRSALSSYVDPLLGVISDPVTKISAYIDCGQLKNAYLIAVKINSSDEVKRISKEAERLGQSAIHRICERRLEMLRKS